MTDQLATTGTTSGFTGADVDGLDKLAQEFTQASQVCSEVKAACEVIVAAASMFGPFAAGFIAYLKGTVIPWLTKVGEALSTLAKVLSVHSQAQKDASSTTTSLPSYVSTGTTPPAAIDTASASSAPSTIPAATTDPSTVASLDPASGTTSTTGGDTVGLLTVPVTIGPDGTVTGLFHGSLGDANVDPATSTLAPTSNPTAAPIPSAPPALTAMPTHDLATPLTHAAHAAPLGGGGNSGGGGGGVPASVPSSGPTLGTPLVTTPDATPHAQLAADQTPLVHTAAHHAQAQLQAQHIGSHDGLWSGLGQATGIGAGGAALARAVLVEARRRAEGTSGGVLSPFDADADGTARSSIFDGALG